MTTIKFERERRSWSMKKLAQVAGVNAKTISRLENGDPVSADTLRQVRAALDLPVSDKTMSQPRLDHYPITSPSIAKSELILKGASLVYLVAMTATLPLTWMAGWVFGLTSAQFAPILAGWILFTFIGIFSVLFLSMVLFHRTCIRIRTQDAGEAMKNRIWHAIRDASGLQDVVYSNLSSRNGEHRLTFLANVKPEDHAALHQRLRDLGLDAVVESRVAKAEPRCLTAAADRVTS